MSVRSFSHEPMNFKIIPPAIKGLLIANVAVFFLSFLVGSQFYDLFGLVPQRLIHNRWIWQPFTYLFIHGGFFHLLFNLFALWMFGMPVESQWGRNEFLKYYFICGLGAALASVLLSPGSSTPVIGASGPVYGMLVAFAMLYPEAVIYLYFFIPVKAKHLAIIFGVIEFFSGYSNSSPGIANFAHLGGMVTGYVYIRWWWVIKIRSKGVLAGLIGGLGSTAGRSRRPSRSPTEEQPTATKVKTTEETGMAEVDRILDKILVSGLDSLTEEERAIMRRYSDKTQH